MASIHHHGRVTLAAFALGLGFAWWLTPPVIAGLLTVGCGAAFWLLVFFPSAIAVRVRGPGYQYRDDAERR